VPALKQTDKMKPTIEEIIKELRTYQMSAMSMALDMLELTQQRDEARARLTTFEPTIRNLTKERNEARAELTRLQAERDLWQQIQRDETTCKQSLQVRPEPSRLEIAAMMASSWVSNPAHDETSVDTQWWLKQADALIAAAREAK
jgi:uncharacterized coiled-coil DUF342 family protein